MHTIRHTFKIGIFPLSLMVILIALFTGCSNSTPEPGNIIFISDRDGDKEIFRMKQDGSQVTRITDNMVDERCADVSEDGQSIAFTGWELYRIHEPS